MIMPISTLLFSFKAIADYLYKKRLFIAWLIISTVRKVPENWNEIFNIVFFTQRLFSEKNHYNMRKLWIWFIWITI